MSESTGRLTAYIYVSFFGSNYCVQKVQDAAPKLENQIIFEPEAQFAPCRALAGQNDYIDILGKFSPNYSTLFDHPL